MEVTRSSEMSVSFQLATRRYTPEDGTLSSVDLTTAKFKPLIFSQLLAIFRVIYKPSARTTQKRHLFYCCVLV
jgi:hypothetical protein